MENDFSANDYIMIMQEINYNNYCIGLLDSNLLEHAAEIVARRERNEYLEDLLNQWRAIVRRKGFKLIRGGKDGG